MRPNSFNRQARSKSRSMDSGSSLMRASTSHNASLRANAGRQLVTVRSLQFGVFDSGGKRSSDGERRVNQRVDVGAARSMIGDRRANREFTMDPGGGGRGNARFL